MGFFMRSLRRCYYKALNASNPIYASVQNCTGFGIYDRAVIERLKNHPRPFSIFQGLSPRWLATLNMFPITGQNVRLVSPKMNLFSLWDEGVVGLINNSKLAIRITTFNRYPYFLSLIRCGFFVYFCLSQLLGRLSDGDCSFDYLTASIARLFDDICWCYW